MRHLTEDQKKLAADNIGLAYWIAEKMWRGRPIVRGLGDLDDVKSECLLALSVAAAYFRPDGVARFTTYAYLVITRRVIQAARKGSGAAHLALISLPRGLDLDARGGMGEEAILVGDLLGRVNLNYRKAVEMYYLQDDGKLTLKEVGRRLGKSKQEVHRLVKAGVEQMRRLVDAEE